MNLVFLLNWTVAVIVEITFVITLLQESLCSTSELGSPRLRKRSLVCADIPWVPEHDSDGSFLAVQCKGEEENGRCFCYNPSGSRIFGWSWWSSSENMTCRCSRQRYRLNAQLGRNDVSLHCTQNGNYEQLQCDDKLCWCVEPTSGNPKERFYPQTMMKYLPCYTEMYSGTKREEAMQPRRYLRQCESKALARLAILGKLEAHGRLNTHIDEALCDNDGSYAKYKLEKTRVYCVWKDSKKIENYQSEIKNILAMDCNCARDLMTYADENLEMFMSCQSNGNYESFQTSNKRPYCVDNDGFATTELCDFDKNLTCPRGI